MLHASPAANSAPVYCIALSGLGHLPFLLPCLYSITRADPGADTLVVHTADDPREIALLAAAFPRTVFATTDPLVGPDAHARIAQKMSAWAEACALTESRFGSRPLVLLDADTLVREPVLAGVSLDADAAFTVKPQGFPINTGVLIARSPAVGKVLCKAIDARARQIAADTSRFAEAKRVSGAADQHALRELLAEAGMATPCVGESAEVDALATPLRLRALPCSEFNQTECTTLTDQTRVVHYKSGWHPILLEAAPFTDARPRQRCTAMLDLFRRTERESARYLARRIVMDACEAHADAFSGMMRVLDVEAPFFERGVLHSEMLAACATARKLGLETIIESGRYLGQSTRVLSRWIAASGGRVVSYERFRDDAALRAESELQTVANVELRYADACHTLTPALAELTRPSQDAGCAGHTPRVGLFLDGPKGVPANHLACDAFDEHAGVWMACIHDARLETPGRAELDEQSARRVFFTDDAEFVELYQHLDRACLTPQALAGDPGPHDWRPYHRGRQRRRSYGPTLAICLPSPTRRVGTR